MLLRSKGHSGAADEFEQMIPDTLGKPLEPLLNVGFERVKLMLAEAAVQPILQQVNAASDDTVFIGQGISRERALEIMAAQTPDWMRFKQSQR